MKKLLILSYYFPPMGTGGVQRAVKFAKYLPEFGWLPIVITVKNVEYYSYDNSLLEEIRKIKIVRTVSLDPLRLSSILKKILHKKKSDRKKSYEGGMLKRFYNIFSRWFFIIDTKVFWVPFAVLKSIKIIKDENIQVVFTTSPPNSVHIAGLILKNLLKIKWAADFRDYWIMDGISNFPTPLHSFINDYIRKKILKNADHIIGVSEGITDEAKTAYKKEEEDYSLIMNGFDSDDFPKNIHKKDYKKFHIIHTGTFNYINNPDNFLSGLESAVKEIPDLRKDTLFLHIGISIDYNLLNEAKKRGVEDIIIEKGYIEHKESIKLLLMSDLLLLVHSDFCLPGMIPLKVFEYLASRIPILAVTPEGEASDLIERYNIGTVCKNEEIEKIKDAILFYYEKWKINKLDVKKEDIFQIPEELEKYSRRNLTKDLTNILDRLIN